jgi:predicted nucleic acid-binding protein
VSDLVVDASVAVKWFVQESDSETAHRILSAPVRLHAPALLRLELANGMWKNWRKKLVSVAQISETMASIDRTIGAWREIETLLDAALKLSVALDHVIYDCLYLALAQELGAPLVSVDKKLLAVAPAGTAIALTDWQP